MGPNAMIFVFWMWRFKPPFSLSSFTLIKRLFSFSLLSALRVVSFACVCVLVTQLCPTLCESMDCSQLVSSVLGILQARILEWVAIHFSRRSSQPRDRTQVSSTAGRFSTFWVTREAYMKLLLFLRAILIPSYGILDSILFPPSTAFLIQIHSAYKLNKHSDYIQPCRTPFPIWNQSVVPCLVLTVASWPAYRFLRRQVR